MGGNSVEGEARGPITIEVQIEHRDRELDRSIEDNVQIADGITVPREWVTLRKAEGVPQLTDFVITVAAGVTAALLAKGVELAARWIHDRLENRRDKIISLRIDRKWVEVDEGEIRRVLYESVQIKEQD